MGSIDNILTFIELKNLSVREFEQKAGLANGTINNTKQRGADLTSKNVEKIAKAFADELKDAGFYVLDLAAFGREGYTVVKEEGPKQGPALQNKEEPTALQILSVLADAFKAQTEIMKSIEKKMAQESTQAIINKRTEEIQSSLESLSNGHQSIAIPLGVDRTILLRSLARLEGLKDENALLSEADNRIDEREAASVRLGKIHADDKKNTEVPE